MARIVLLGSAGTGKTTFSRRYSERTGARLIHLDGIWASLPEENRVENFRARLVEAHAAESWISDGNFALATFDMRLPRATEIVWLEAPRWLSLLRAFRRLLQKDSDHSLAKIGSVVAYIWIFNRDARPRIEAAIAAHGANLRVTHLGGARAIEAFFASL